MGILGPKTLLGKVGFALGERLWILKSPKFSACGGLSPPRTVMIRAEGFFGLAGFVTPIIPEPEKRKIPERKIP